MGNTGSVSKKQAVDIILERFLEEIENSGQLPWQRPYQNFNSFNYVSLKPYRGINRILLPFGEYITFNQIMDYNKQHNTDFRPLKGHNIWFPICFFKEYRKEVAFDNLPEEFKEKDVRDADPDQDFYLGWSHGGLYVYRELKYYRINRVLQYTPATDRTNVVNSKGECLPSKLDLHEIEITYSDAYTVFNNYTRGEGIKVDSDYKGTPCYVPREDLICFNKYMVNEEELFSTIFHEAIHSTGKKERIDRVSMCSMLSEPYAEEECIAEIGAHLLCCECNIGAFKTSCTMVENQAAYVANWKQKITDWGSKFLGICQKADEAYEYILKYSI